MDRHNGQQGAGPVRLIGEAEKTAGGIYYSKGPEFHTKFMAQYIMPFRRETMMMCLGSMIQSGAELSNTKALARAAYAIADEIVLMERVTLDPKMGMYWDLYIEQSKSTDEVMKAVEEMREDYHLTSD